MSELILSVKNLTTHYITQEFESSAVNGISFDLNKGETLGIVGETGAGKTTMALSIMGLLPKKIGKILDGEIIYDGMDLLGLKEEEMRYVRGQDIAMIYQDPMNSLNPVLTVGEQIAEVLQIHTKLNKEQISNRVNEILELVGIPASRKNEYPHQFSGGMKQRIVIAMALVCDPKILIADEPTTALDVTIQAQVLEMMNELKSKMDSSMIFITHDLGIIVRMCDYVAIMYAGEIIEYGSTEEIFTNFKHPYTKGLFDSVPSLTKKVDRLIPIGGLMADSANLPSGCKFHPRCPRCTEKCKTEQPILKNLGDTHSVCCHLSEEVPNE